MLSDRLRKTREGKGLSQAELARMVGVGRDSYNRYERAGIQPSNETLVSIAECLDVTTDYLLGASDEPSRPVLLNSENERLINDLRKIMLDLGVLHKDVPLNEYEREHLLDYFESAIKTYQKAQKIACKFISKRA